MLMLKRVMKMIVTPKNIESIFDIDERFFSTTDKRGDILSGNNVFIKVSKYTKEELIGRPHNIIRHPDMPKAVFKVLWDYIDNGKTITAYVKNMAKDGSFYWVLATVFPINNRYLSIRIKPTSSIFSLIPSIYKKMIKKS
jgi:aerotaxis receptor